MPGRSRRGPPEGRSEAHRVREGQGGISGGSLDKLPGVVDTLIKAVALRSFST